MSPARVVIIPFLAGRLTTDGQLVEPDIDSIFEKWLERHPEYREKEFHIIRAKSYQTEDGLDTVLVRVTAGLDEELAAYNPADDADLYEEFLLESESPRTEPQKIWVQQCEAVKDIESEYGVEKALGYVIGEKLLSYIEVAERSPEWRKELPHFVAKIKSLFEPWQILQFLETPHRLGPLGHTADEAGHLLFRSQLDDSEKLREDSRNLRLFEQAREWLLEDWGDT